MSAMPPVFVVSLARATERRADIARRLEESQIAHKIIDAVDGAKVDMAALGDRVKNIGLAAVKNGVAFDRGSLGCYLSHYQLWERMAREKIPHAVIMEDDARWTDDFAPIVGEVVNCKWRWDVVLLHGDIRRGAKRTICPLGARHHLVQYQRHPFALVAYLISQAGAKKLVDYCRDIRLPIDSQWKPWWQWNGNFYCVHPKVAAVTGAASTILKVAEETGGARAFSHLTLRQKFVKSYLAKRERIGHWFYYHARRPRQKEGAE